MRIIETKAYQFSELNDKAKEKAIETYRSNGIVYEWREGVFEYVKYIGKLIGIEIDNIYFSGFYSQGDGACFEGYYSYRKNGLKGLIEEFPTALEVHGIAADLQAIQQRFFYGLTAVTKHRGHYYHSGCMDIRVYQNAGMDYANIDVESEVSDLLRQFADWIYSQLEAEYDYLMSDEVVRATIEDNGYEFDEEGNRI